MMTPFEEITDKLRELLVGNVDADQEDVDEQ